MESPDYWRLSTRRRTAVAMMPGYRLTGHTWEKKSRSSALPDLGKSGRSTRRRFHQGFFRQSIRRHDRPPVLTSWFPDARRLSGRPLTLRRQSSNRLDQMDGSDRPVQPDAKTRPTASKAAISASAKTSQSKSWAQISSFCGRPLKQPNRIKKTSGIQLPDVFFNENNLVPSLSVDFLSIFVYHFEWKNYYKLKNNTMKKLFSCLFLGILIIISCVLSDAKAVTSSKRKRRACGWWASVCFALGIWVLYQRLRLRILWL